MFKVLRSKTIASVFSGNLFIPYILVGFLRKPIGNALLLLHFFVLISLIGTEDDNMKPLVLIQHASSFYGLFRQSFENAPWCL